MKKILCSGFISKTKVDGSYVWSSLEVRLRCQPYLSVSACVLTSEGISFSGWFRKPLFYDFCMIFKDYGVNDLSFFVNYFESFDEWVYEIGLSSGNFYKKEFEVKGELRVLLDKYKKKSKDKFETYISSVFKYITDFKKESQILKQILLDLSSKNLVSSSNSVLLNSDVSSSTPSIKIESEKVDVVGPDMKKEDSEESSSGAGIE